MKSRKKKKLLLEQNLKTIASEGIKVNMEQLKKDMVSQFSDPYEAFRELVVNAYDAKASMCEIWLEEDDDTMTVLVRDNGTGMDKQGLLDYFTLYRSRKRLAKDLSIGIFGIGKLSIAAINGQRSLRIKTSNGKSCWLAETGNLLSSDPITLHKIEISEEHEISKGTLFEIVFEKNDLSLPDVYTRIVKVLNQYTRYLAIRQVVCHPECDNTSNSDNKTIIRESWIQRNGISLCFPEEDVNGNTYEITFDFDDNAHELYQHRVFITDKFNLWSHDLDQSICIPHIRVRVDSKDFAIPFGRHTISNEEVLPDLSRHIRNILLPKFYQKLYQIFVRGKQRQYLGKNHKFVEVTIALISHIPDLKQLWSEAPIFKVYPFEYLSLAELEHVVCHNGQKIYLNDPDNSGVDYSMFDGPVVLQDQNQQIISFVKNYFVDKLQDLSNNQLIIEQPTDYAPQLRKVEQAFSKYLTFMKPVKNYDAIHELRIKSYFEDEVFLMDGTAGSNHDTADLERLLSARWRLGHLVERDGISKCKRVIYLSRNDQVILNLYNPQIQQLVKLSILAPHLSAHWAIAMCLTDKYELTEHLDGHIIEDLLIEDILSKVGNIEESQLNVQTNSLGIARDAGRGLEYSNN